MEERESPLAAAERELHEELGLVARRWVEAVRMVMANEITHAPSCTLILKAQLWLEVPSK